MLTIDHRRLPVTSYSSGEYQEGFRNQYSGHFLPSHRSGLVPCLLVRRILRTAAPAHLAEIHLLRMVKLYLLIPVLTLKLKTHFLLSRDFNTVKTVGAHKTYPGITSGIIFKV